MAENSKAGTVVGTIQTKDPDNLLVNRQSFTYTLLDGDQKRFKIENGVVKVNTMMTRTNLPTMWLWLL